MKKTFILTVFFINYLLVYVNCQTPVPYPNPCDGTISYVNIQNNLALNKPTRQSSTYYGGLSNFAVDGVGASATAQFSRTAYQNQPWWEVDLGASYLIRGVKILYPTASYPQGLNNYYMFFSEVPLDDSNLDDLVSSAFVDHIYVDQSISSGTEIPAQYKRARYIRIQLEDAGSADFYEISIPGGPGGQPEICDNGIDDDLDCKVDCDDSECTPVIWWVNKKDPTCPICNDGYIEIKAYGDNLLYSIDDGLTFHPCEPVVDNSGWCGFYNLPEIPDGRYTIKVTNGICTSTLGLPVVLAAPPGVPNNCCNNGDFESGNFNNWKGGVANISTNPPGEATIPELIFENNNETIDPEHHNIISSSIGYTDPVISTLPISGGGTGTYLARLGSNIPGYDGRKLTYCFTVTECNVNFLFNYLVVLQDPVTITSSGDATHLLHQKPFFQFTITDKTTNEVVKMVKRISDITDPYFNVFNLPNTEDDVAYTFWKCESTDLSGREGHDMCIEFIAANCSKGAHYGYAYIDGLCNSIEDMKPRPILQNFRETYCGSQKITIDGTESYGYNQFGWRICRLLGSQEVDCFEEPLAPNGNIGILDLKQVYASGGYALTCGNNYRVTLTLDNDCGEPVSVTKDVKYLCQEGVDVEYGNIINCHGISSDLQIVGTIQNCSPCNISWTPASLLNNATIPNPIFLGTSNPNVIDQTFHIVAQDALGCIDEDDVQVDNVYKEDFKTTAILTFCDIHLQAVFTSAFPTPRNTIASVTFTNLTTGETLSTTLVESAQESNTWSFITATFPKNTFSAGIWQAVFQFNSSSQIFCESVSINVEVTSEALSLYYGNFVVAVPNAFTPFVTPGANDTFGPAVFGAGLTPDLEDGKYGHNAYWGRIQIYMRWGPKIFDKTLEGTPEQPFNIRDLQWDGMINGIPASSDVYVFIIELKNCTHFDGTLCPDPTSEEEILYPNNPDCNHFKTGCNCNYWRGNVTLIN